ncbi:hypothetical protein K0A97_02000 [Patescibacteria group bacterium]|nr:hypothetical protein [Patescibacteria group bacterium]
MVLIKKVSAKHIPDSRKEKTIFVEINTNVGSFSGSSPTGKSTGKYEAKPYKKNLEKDIETIKKFSDYFSDEIIDTFDDLRRVEDIADGHFGANTLFALESAILKALSKEKKKEVWELLNPALQKERESLILPRPVGNCIGGGKHSDSKENPNKRPDFQEFLLIPKEGSIKSDFEVNKRIKKELESFLSKKDKQFKKKRNDEDAWETTLNEKEILELLSSLKGNFDLGVDVAASGFYKRKKYQYYNPLLQRKKEEQFLYISNLIKNYNVFYIEDPFEEEDFESHAKLLEKFPESLIVGDDLIVTNYKRFEKAIKTKSVNAIIVKPNQNGSLMEVKRICQLAKSNNIKIVFSHRSGETEEGILADLAFGFQAEFFKAGITGKEREIKMKRLIEIEKKLK